MSIRFAFSALLTAIVLGGILPVAAANAQTPPPKKESELVAAGHKPLTGAQISAKFVGNTSYVLFLAPTGGAKAGTQVTIFQRDARVRVTVPGAGLSTGKKVESNWWIEGNLSCAEQRIINLGHACYSHYEVDSSIYSCVQPAGDCIFLSRIVPGNPDNI